jgi:hypothetical protein
MLFCPMGGDYNYLELESRGFCGLGVMTGTKGDAMKNKRHTKRDPEWTPLARTKRETTLKSDTIAVRVLVKVNMASNPVFVFVH